MDGIRGVIHMLYRRLRRRKIHINTYRAYRRPLPRVQRIIMFLTICFLVIAAVVSIVLIQLRPLMYKMAKTAVTDVVGIEINDVITMETLGGSFDYSKLVTLVKDNDGNIAALTMNTALVNTLQTRISKNVFKNVNNEVVSDLKIPIGNAIGGVLFSGRGPNFTVKILSVVDVDTKFTSSFEAVGINQTRHKIYLDIWADIDIVIPGYGNKTITITTQVAVADTVITGQVPNVYADIGNTGGDS
jgi:sporulation protein YunB